ncbi:VWA domain-containing protein [Streptomyces sp. NBC_01408]|uniref:VWA domain-containing protein n=1 Tax=Streptomyces sp. NBC_01408 TaxID=2903855 RepID=UPI0022549CC6|nr:VWA domain-containing protein [Streptomyces sp. NBC_01408]MCX4696961.1 VWA domain-containing protein [Streptomyces sp. NBC_01408]
MTTEDPGGFAAPAPAVLYIARRWHGFWAPSARRIEQECRQRAMSRGLTLLDPTARNPEEVDRLLRDTPDRAVVAEPAIVAHDALRTSLLSSPDILDGLLGLGATLRPCDDRAAPATTADRLSDGTAVLLTHDPFGPELPRAELDRRACECQEYAERCGLHVDRLLDGEAAYIRFIEEELAKPATGPVRTIVVHPGAFAVGLGRDAQRSRPGKHGDVWRWLLQGRVVHSAGQLRSTRPGGVRLAKGGLQPEPVTPLDNHVSGEAREPFLEWNDTAEPVIPPDAPEAEARGVARPTVRKWESRGVPPTPASSRNRPAPSPAYPPAPAPAPAEAYGYPQPQPPAPAYGYPQRPAQAYDYPQSPAIRAAPMPATGSPLPHDGLFIRRRSAYGTRSVLGVTELIDSGVLIEQDQIRFDDFVAARTDQVPGPPEGEALAVSHGLARVPGDSKAHEATTHFVEIALKAGAEAQPGTGTGTDTGTDMDMGTGTGAHAKEPLPVNFVFVVDTSSSMEGEKLDTVKSALQEIYERLRPTDSLGIVTFATNVSTLLQATRKEDLSPEKFAATVAGMTAYGGTDIQLGVQYGIVEIGRRASSGRTVNRLYLFSDGDPTSGERNWTTVRKNIAARLRGDLTLSCFGFGTDARMTELSALAGTARGHCTFVTRPEQVRSGLLEDLERRDHLAAIDIQLRIDIDPAVTVWHLYGHDLVTDQRARARVFRESREAARRAREEYGTEALPDLITGEKGIRIFAPDLAFGETYWVVLEIQVPEGRPLAGGIGTATVQYVDTLARENRSRELALADATTLSEETVTVHAVGLRTSEITFHALDDLYENDRDAAGRRLSGHIEVLKQVHQAFPVPEFVNDRVTIEKLLVLAGSLGTFAAFSDSAVSPAGPTIRRMNEFARIRSGAAF